MYFFLGLGSFTQHNYFEIYSYVADINSLLLFVLFVTNTLIFHCIDIPLIVYSYKHLLMDIYVQPFVQTHAFISLGSIPRNGMARSQSRCMVNFLGKFPNCFLKWLNHFAILPLLYIHPCF